MKPLNIALLGLSLALSALVAALVCDVIAARGGVIPVPGWLTGLVLLALAGVLVWMGLALRRYVEESEERRRQPTLAPRRHQLDLPTAYRTLLLARSAAITGSIAGGAFAGQALYLATSGGNPLSAIAPTTFAAIGGIVVAVVGVVVERWGKLPPHEGSASSDVDGSRA